MKNMKKYLGVGVAFFVAVILLSSATAMPIINKEAVDNIINMNIEQDESSEKELCKMYNFEITPSCWNGLWGGTLRALFMDMTTIDKCWEYYNNNTFRAKLIETQTAIENEINKLPEQDRELVKEFLHFEETFSLAGIAERISTLTVGNLLYDVQDLLEVPDNYVDYNVSNRAEVNKYLEIMYNNDFENGTAHYPLVDFICRLLRIISGIWTLPLLFLGGVIGLIIAGIITMVFFSPIIMPMSLCVGVMECVKNDPDLKAEIIRIAILSGVVGLIIFIAPLLLEKLWIDGWYDVGYAYVLDRLVISGVEWDGTVLTHETAPLFNGLEVLTSRPALGVPVDFCADVEDYNVVYDPYKDKACKRDHVQVGWDWNNDLVVDEWSDLYKQPIFGGCIIPASHTFNNFGEHKVNVYVRDTWGLTSEPVSIYINIEKVRDRSVVNMPFLDNFPRLKLLFRTLLVN